MPSLGGVLDGLWARRYHRAAIMILSIHEVWFDDIVVARDYIGPPGK